MGVDVRINQRKLRDAEYPYERPAGVQRVVMLGDSVTFGWGVPAEATVSKRLERALRAAGRGVEVINTGVIRSPDVRYYPVSIDRFIREILDQEFRD